MSELSRTRAVKPEAPDVITLSVITSRRVSPGFQRVTVGGAALEDLPSAGFDQWFRLFFPDRGQQHLRLMEVTDGQWYRNWLDLPDEDRPVCRNYTIREFRPEQAELDIDFVLHRGADGTVEGAAAQWALAAEADGEVAILDQGILFNPVDGHTDLLVVCDESGLPGVEGIARDLPRDQVGRVVIEVPTADDVRRLANPPGVEVQWLPRGRTPVGAGDSSAPVGSLAAPAALATPVSDGTYAYLVGEASFVTGLRSRLVDRGMPKGNIDFCSYWRTGRRR